MRVPKFGGRRSAVGGQSSVRDRKKRGDKDAQTRVKTLDYNRTQGWCGGRPPRQNKNWIPRIALLEATAVALLVVNGYAAGGFLRIPGMASNPAPAEGGAPKVFETAGLAIAWAISDVIAGVSHTSGASQSAPAAGGTNYYRVGGAPSQIGRPWTDTRSGAGGQIYAARNQSFGLPFGGIGIFDRKGRSGGNIGAVIGSIIRSQSYARASTNNNSTGARIGTSGTSAGDASFASASGGGGGSGGRDQSFGAANRSYAGSDVGGHRPEVPPSVATAISGAASSGQSSVVSGQSSTSTASFASASTFQMAAGSGGSGGAGGVDPIWLGTGGTLNWNDPGNWNPNT